MGWKEGVMKGRREMKRRDEKNEGDGKNDRTGSEEKGKGMRKGKLRERKFVGGSSETTERRGCEN